MVIFNSYVTVYQRVGSVMQLDEGHELKVNLRSAAPHSPLSSEKTREEGHSIETSLPGMFNPEGQDR